MKTFIHNFNPVLTDMQNNEFEFEFIGLRYSNFNQLISILIINEIHILLLNMYYDKISSSYID